MSTSALRHSYTKEYFVSEKWEIVKVDKTYLSGFTKEREYALNTETGRLFLGQVDGDSLTQFAPSGIRSVGFSIVLGYIPYSLLSIAWHILRIPFDICEIAYKALAQVSADWNQGGGVRALALLAKRIIVDIPFVVLSDLWEAIKDPCYGIALTLCGLCTIFFPLFSREYLDSKIEYTWHHEVSYEEDFRSTLTQAYLKCWKENYPGYQKFEYIPFTFMETVKIYWAAFKAAKVFYLAWCLQSRGHLSSKTEDGQYKITLINPTQTVMNKLSANNIDYYTERNSKSVF